MFTLAAIVGVCVAKIDPRQITVQLYRMECWSWNEHICSTSWQDFCTNSFSSSCVSSAHKATCSRITSQLRLTSNRVSSMRNILSWHRSTANKKGRLCSCPSVPRAHKINSLSRTNYWPRRPQKLRAHLFKLFWQTYVTQPTANRSRIESIDQESCCSVENEPSNSYEEPPNFRRLLLGCIEAGFCNWYSFCNTFKIYILWALLHISELKICRILHYIANFLWNFHNLANSGELSLESFNFSPRISQILILPELLPEIPDKLNCRKSMHPAEFQNFRKSRPNFGKF